MKLDRFPNRTGMMRGPNMRALFCQSCQEEKTHGFKLFDNSGEVFKSGISAIFICDECLSMAKKPIEAK